MKKVGIIFMAAAFSVVLTQAAMARDFIGIYKECGLGGMIAPRDPIIAVITNVIWDFGTTAVSSNVISPDTCSGVQQKAAAFIHDTYASLETDMASGYGAHLDTLMTLVGYESDAKQYLVKALRADFAKQVAAPGYTAKNRFERAEALYDLLYKQIERGSVG
mgnify:CR=1 FL=1